MHIVNNHLLLYCNALGKISRLVDVIAALNGNIFTRQPY